jgi:hypothetical protein
VVVAEVLATVKQAALADLLKGCLVLAPVHHMLLLLGVAAVALVTTLEQGAAAQVVSGH